MIGRERPAFRRRVTSRFKDEVLTIARAANAHIEALVVVLVDEHVGAVFCAEYVAIQLELALLFLVLDGIEQRPIVGRPCH